MPLVTSRFLDLRALAALENMRFTTRHRIDGAYTGRHPSRQHGGAGEFVDFREYTRGEDLRRLDWKTLARTGRAFVRLYQDEANLVCTLALDASGSMAFGGHVGRPATGAPATKLAYIQCLASALTHIITRQQDQAGLAILSDDLGEFFAPSAAATHTALIQQAIDRLQTRPATNLAVGLRSLFQRLTRRGVLLLMSDFLVDDPESVFAVVRQFRHRRFEVVVLHIVHPDEERLPRGLAFRFEGMENDGRADCSPDQIHRLYEQRFEAHAAAVRTLALAAGCDYRRVNTAVSYLQTLGGFLVERSG